MRIYMQIPAMDGAAPRFYQLALEPDLLEGWTLIREWGQAGSAGRVKREHFADLETAQAAMEAARNAQTKRGYQVVFVQGQPPRG